MARPAPHPKVGLALAGGGPFGGIYEIGALLALEESIEGLDLNALDCYVGVSAGGFLAAALANGIRVRDVHALFIEGRSRDREAPAGFDIGALTPRLFMRPALREYARCLAALPGLCARALWRQALHPLSSSPLDAFASLGAAIPTGLFDSEAIHAYLHAAFTRPGRTDDFRKLRRRLFIVATDLDTGQSVTFGRPGRDHVPISKAVQASASLPGLFPPVEIDGHWFVDGALKKTLHASEALDEGARLVLCVNPIGPHDAKLAAERGRVRHARLVEGGLPVVLSQTFRAVIHSRLAAGLSKYRTQYPHADVVLFEPAADDSEIFFTNPFGYAMRRRVCEHAYLRTRAALVARRAELAPVLARHGLRLRVPAGVATRRHADDALADVAAMLRGALGDLSRELHAKGTAPRA